MVEPEHDINVGHCCRAMKNFGFAELALVNPKCELGFDANMYAKHGSDVLKKSKMEKTIANAARGCALVVGTTGVERRSGEIIRNPMRLREFAARMAKKKGKMALLLGREGTGLSPDEIRACDFLVTIPANGNYPVLNLSHALAVMLYELRMAGNAPEKKKNKTSDGLASPGERKALLAAFAKIVGKGKARKPDKIAIAFKNVVERAMVSPLEARAMLSGLKEK